MTHVREQVRNRGRRTRRVSHNHQCRIQIPELLTQSEEGRERPEGHRGKRRGTGEEIAELDDKRLRKKNAKKRRVALQATLPAEVMQEFGGRHREVRRMREKSASVELCNVLRSGSGVEGWRRGAVLNPMHVARIVVGRERERQTEAL